MKKPILVLLVILLQQIAYSQGFICHPNDAILTPREHPVDIIKMKVEVSFVPTQKLVKGKVTHTFTPLRKKVESIFFDAPGISILSAKLDGKTVPFDTTNEGVTVRLSPAIVWDKTYNLEFEYTAHPEKGIYFIGWDQPEDPVNTNPWRIRKQIWTQGQGHDNRYWIPMYDEANDKYITETVVTFDKKYKVLSNGNKVAEKDNGDGNKTWQYAMTKPHAGYLLMLGIGQYEIAERKTSRGTPLHFWYYADTKDRMEPTYRYSEQMFDFLEKETGIPYPWESYSQIMVQDFLYGAMENTTATIFGDFFNVDARAYMDGNYVGVNCHELTHQWFGDYITHRSNSEMWLHESYATYFPKLMKLRMEGKEAYQWAVKSEMDRSLEAGKKDSYPVRHSMGGSARNYPKGSLVIGMLKDVVGEEEFNRALNHYLKTHAYQNVETNDLYQAIQDVTGQAPSWFFEQWLYKGGEPHYQVSYEDLKGTQRFTRLSVQQIQPQNEWVGLFKMPIDIEVYYKNGGSTLVRDTIQYEYETVDIPNPENKEVAFVLFDAGNRVLKNLTYKRNYAELEAQTLLAKEPIDKYLALLELRNFPIDQKRDLLRKVYDTETFYGLRAEAIGQLANDKESQEYVKKGLKDKSVEVRKAVIENTKAVPFELLENYEAMLKDSSYKVIELTFDLLCKDYSDIADRFIAAFEGVYGMNNILRIKYLEKIGTFTLLSKHEHWVELVSYAGPAYEFRTRLNAMAALKRMAYMDDQFLAHLLNGCVSPNRRLAGPFYETLEWFSGIGSMKGRMQSMAHNLEGKITPKQQAILTKLGIK